MSVNPQETIYRRRITPVERLFTRSPFSIVTLVARIRGQVSEGMLAGALGKVQQRHPLLRSRIVKDDDHTPWFTSEGAGEIPIEVRPRTADDQWVAVHDEVNRTPFAFGERPAIRFTLLCSPEASDLVISCHHIICDGLSLAYLARDLMVYLGDPGREVEGLPDPASVDLDTIPKGVSLHPIAKLLIGRINKKWQEERVLFDQQDYDTLQAAYWANYQHQVLPVEWSEERTSALVARCREHGVTVNTALTAAFVGGQTIVRDGKPYHASIAVAAQLRDRLREPVGEVMGFYAGIASPRFKYDMRVGYWENARRLQKTLGRLYTDKNLFGDALAWCHLDPTILEAIHFKRLGGLVAPEQPAHGKLSAFGERNDVVLRLLQRDKQASLDRIFMGTAITNLGRMDFPPRYGALELDRLIMQPGGAFPLVNVGLVVGAVTCSGKLSLAIEYAPQAVAPEEAIKIKDVAMACLLND